MTALPERSSLPERKRPIHCVRSWTSGAVSVIDQGGLGAALEAQKTPLKRDRQRQGNVTLTKGQASDGSGHTVKQKIHQERVRQ